MILNVGQTYLLPTIQMMIEDRLVRFVVLHEHVGDISGRSHQHLDMRFVPDDVLETLNELSGPDFVSQILACTSRPVTMQEMVCVRKHTPIKTFRKELRDGFMLLQNKHKNLKKTCSVCPHQGCNLKDVPVTKIGSKEVVVCPCHGLTWSASTGEMVRRVPRKQLSN